MSAATGRVMRRRCARSTATTMRALPRRSPNGPRISAPISRDCSKAADIRAAVPISLPMAEPLALYVHWPFCVSKCPYCDFNSHVRERVDQAEWRAPLLADLRHEAALLPGPQVGPTFFAGGHPPP